MIRQLAVIVGAILAVIGGAIFIAAIVLNRDSIRMAARKIAEDKGLRGSLSALIQEKKKDTQHPIVKFRLHVANEEMNVEMSGERMENDFEVGDLIEDRI